MKQKLAIFDLDGTLFDTTGVNYQAYKEAILRVCGTANLSYDTFRDECNGRKYKDFLSEILPSVSDANIEAIHEEKKKLYKTYLKEARSNNGLFELIESIRQDYVTCLATTASRDNVLEILETYGRTGYFDLIITQEDVKMAKPDPEAFLLAMEKAKIGSDKTIIFEDSEVGLLAAFKSGATVFKAMNFNGVSI